MGNKSKLRDGILIILMFVILPNYIKYFIISIIIFCFIIKSIMFKPSIKRLTNFVYEIVKKDNQYILWNNIENKSVSSSIEKYTIINNKVYFIENIDKVKTYSILDYKNKEYKKYSKIKDIDSEDKSVFNNNSLFQTPDKLIRKNIKLT